MTAPPRIRWKDEIAVFGNGIPSAEGIVEKNARKEKLREETETRRRAYAESAEMERARAVAFEERQREIEADFKRDAQERASRIKALVPHAKTDAGIPQQVCVSFKKPARFMIDDNASAEHFGRVVFFEENEVWLVSAKIAAVGAQRGILEKVDD